MKLITINFNPPGGLCKIIRIMKLSVFLFILGIYGRAATGTYAQTAEIRLSTGNKSLQEVFQEIESVSEFIFFYSNNALELNRQVTQKIENGTIHEIMDHLVAGTNAGYRIVDRQVILYRKNEPAPVSSQEKVTKVSGQVTDSYGIPLIGVSILIKGQNTGDITDIDGNYSLDVIVGSTLVFSYIGYDSQEVTVGSQSIINIQMAESSEALDEVVVVGYGSQRKSDLTGGIVSVDASKLQMVSTNNLMDKLAGQVSGLSINSGKAQPGADQMIRVRGENSLTADNSPLVVLDGIPYNGSLNDIDPDVIESLSVLKDASAAAIYGSRGSNGVILIQTKKGEKGAPTVSYKGQIGMQEPERRLNMMNGAEYNQYRRNHYRLKQGVEKIEDVSVESILNPNERENFKLGNETDWQDVMFGKALIHSHQVSVSGGTDFTTYMASVSHMNQDGIVEGTGSSRTNVTVNLTQTFNSWLTVGVGTQATQRDTRGTSETGGILTKIEAGLKMSPYGIHINDDGNYEDYPMSLTLFSHPLANLNADNDRTTRTVFISTFADIKLPVDGLTFRTNLGYNYNNTNYGIYYGRNTLVGRPKDGQAIIKNTHYYDYTWENILKYNQTFGAHKLDVTALYSIQETNRKYAEQQGESFVNDDSGYHNMKGAEKNIEVKSELDETSMMSYMGRINYSYANKYMFTFTARSDGYSAFGANNKYAFFPSIAAAWNLSSEDFFTAGWVDMLKVRASWGSNGNQAIKPYQTLNRLSLAKYIWGNGTIVNGSYLPSNAVGNPNLKWETTRTINAGVDISLFQGRLSGNFDFYVSNTTDLLMSRTVPVMNGYRSIMDNIGETRNIGVEFMINSINVDTKDFIWSSNVNFSLNRDKIIELRGDGEDDISNKWFIGKPLRVFYDYEVIGTWQQHEAAEAAKVQKGAVPGSAKLRDTDKNGKIDSEDRVIIGSKMPGFLMSMGNQFRYKNINLSLLLNGVFGQTKELHDKNLDRWMPDFNYISGMEYWTPENPTNNATSSIYVPFEKHSFYKKMNYVQIKNITLGYTFNKNVLNKIGISALNVNVSVNNLYTFSNIKNALNFDGNDMMLSESGAVEYSNMIHTYPSTRSYMFGLNLTF